MKKVVFIFILLSFLAQGFAQSSQEVPYTLEDRDRIIRTEARTEAIEAKMEAIEAKMDALEQTMMVKFESHQRQLDDLKALFYWGFGILITLFIFMMGYLIWDRRTALKPALDRSAVAEDNTKKLMNALREYAKKDSNLAEILKSHGIL